MAKTQSGLFRAGLSDIWRITPAGFQLGSCAMTALSRRMFLASIPALAVAPRAAFSGVQTQSAAGPFHATGQSSGRSAASEPPSTFHTAP